jgi:hypothetical protein
VKRRATPRHSFGLQRSVNADLVRDTLSPRSGQMPADQRELLVRRRPDRRGRVNGIVFMTHVTGSAIQMETRRAACSP